MGRPSDRPEVGGAETVEALQRDLDLYINEDLLIPEYFLPKFISLKQYDRDKYKSQIASLSRNNPKNKKQIYTHANILFGLFNQADSSNYRNVARCYLQLYQQTKVFEAFKIYYHDIRNFYKLSTCQTIGRYLKWSLRCLDRRNNIFKQHTFMGKILTIISNLMIFPVVYTKDDMKGDDRTLNMFVNKGNLVKLKYKSKEIMIGDNAKEIPAKTVYDFLVDIIRKTNPSFAKIPQYTPFDPIQEFDSWGDNFDMVFGLALFTNNDPPMEMFSLTSINIFKVTRYMVLRNCEKLLVWYDFAKNLLDELDYYKTRNLDDLIKYTPDKMALERFLLMDFNQLSDKSIGGNFVAFQDKLKKTLESTERYYYNVLSMIVIQHQQNNHIIKYFMKRDIITREVNDNILKRFASVRENFINYHPRIDMSRIYEHNRSDRTPLKGIAWVEPLVKYSFCMRLINEIRANNTTVADKPNMICAYYELCQIYNSLLEYAEDLLIKGELALCNKFEQFITEKLYEEHISSPEFLVTQFWMAKFDTLRNDFKSVSDSWFSFAFYMMDRYGMDSELYFPPKSLTDFKRIAPYSFRFIRKGIPDFDKIEINDGMKFTDFANNVAAKVSNKDSKSFKLFMKICEQFDQPIPNYLPLDDVSAFCHKDTVLYPIGEYLRNQFFRTQNIIETRLIEDKITLTVLIYRMICNPTTVEINKRNLNPISKDIIMRKMEEWVKECSNFEYEQRTYFIQELPYVAITSMLGAQPVVRNEISNKLYDIIKCLATVKEDDLEKFFNWIFILYRYFYKFKTDSLNEVANLITREDHIKVLIDFKFDYVENDSYYAPHDYYYNFTSFQKLLRENLEKIRKKRKNAIRQLQTMFRSEQWNTASNWLRKILDGETPVEVYDAIINASYYSFQLCESTPFDQVFKVNFSKTTTNEFKWIECVCEYSKYQYLFESAFKLNLLALYTCFKNRTPMDVKHIICMFYAKDRKFIDYALAHAKKQYYLQLSSEAQLCYKDAMIKKINNFGGAFAEFPPEIFNIVKTLWDGCAIMTPITVPEDFDSFYANHTELFEKDKNFPVELILKYKPLADDNTKLKPLNDLDSFKCSIINCILAAMPETIAKNYINMNSTTGEFPMGYIILKCLSSLSILPYLNTLPQQYFNYFMEIIKSRIPKAKDETSIEFIYLLIYAICKYEYRRNQPVFNEALRLTSIAVTKDEEVLKSWIRWITLFYEFLAINGREKIDQVPKEIKEWDDYATLSDFDFKKLDADKNSLFSKFQFDLRVEIKRRPSYFQNIIQSKLNNYEIIKYFFDAKICQTGVTPAVVLAKLSDVVDTVRNKTKLTPPEVSFTGMETEDDFGWVLPVIKYSHIMNLIEESRSLNFIAIYDFIQLYPDYKDKMTEFLNNDRQQFLDDLEKDISDSMYAELIKYPDLFSPNNVFRRLNALAVPFKALNQQSVDMLKEIIQKFPMEMKIQIPKKNFLAFFEVCQKIYPFLSDVNGFWKYKPSKFTTFQTFAKDVKKLMAKKVVPEFETMRQFCDDADNSFEYKFYFGDIKDLKNQEFKKIPMIYILLQKYPEIQSFINSLNSESLTVGHIVFRFMYSLNIIDLNENDSPSVKNLINKHIKDTNEFEKCTLYNFLPTPKTERVLLTYYVENQPTILRDILAENRFDDSQINSVINDKIADKATMTAIIAREVLQKLEVQLRKRLTTINKYFIMNFCGYKHRSVINSSLSIIFNWAERENYSNYSNRYFSDVFKTYNINKREFADSAFVADQFEHFSKKLREYIAEEANSADSPINKIQLSIDEIMNKQMTSLKSEFVSAVADDLKSTKNNTIKVKWVEYSAHVLRILKTLPQVMMKPTNDTNSIPFDKEAFFRKVQQINDAYGDYNEIELVFQNKGQLKVVNNKSGKYFKYPFQKDPYFLMFTPGIDRSHYSFENCNPELFKVKVARAAKEINKTDEQTFNRIHSQLINLINETKEENVVINTIKYNDFINVLVNSERGHPEEFVEMFKNFDINIVELVNTQKVIKKFKDIANSLNGLIQQKDVYSKKMQSFEDSFKLLTNIEVPKVQKSSIFYDYDFKIQTKFVPTITIDQDDVKANFNTITLLLNAVNNKRYKKFAFHIHITGDFQYLYINLQCENKNDQDLVNYNIVDDLIIFMVSVDQIQSSTKLIKGTLTVANIEIPFILSLKMSEPGDYKDVDFIFSKFAAPSLKFESLEVPVLDGKDMTAALQAIEKCSEIIEQFPSMVFMNKVRSVPLPDISKTLFKYFSDVDKWFSTHEVSKFAPYYPHSIEFPKNFMKLESSLGLVDRSMVDSEFEFSKIFRFLTQEDLENLSRGPSMEQIAEPHKQEPEPTPEPESQPEPVVEVKEEKIVEQPESVYEPEPEPIPVPQTVPEPIGQLAEVKQPEPVPEPEPIPVPQPVPQQEEEEFEEEYEDLVDAQPSPSPQLIIPPFVQQQIQASQQQLPMQLQQFAVSQQIPMQTQQFAVPQQLQQMPLPQPQQMPMQQPQQMPMQQPQQMPMQQPQQMPMQQPQQMPMQQPQQMPMQQPQQMHQRPDSHRKDQKHSGRQKQQPPMQNQIPVQQQQVSAPNQGVYSQIPPQPQKFVFGPEATFSQPMQMQQQQFGTPQMGFGMQNPADPTQYMQMQYQAQFGYGAQFGYNPYGAQFNPLMANQFGYGMPYGFGMQPNYGSPQMQMQQPMPPQMQQPMQQQMPPQMQQGAPMMQQFGAPQLQMQQPMQPQPQFNFNANQMQAPVPTQDENDQGGRSRKRRR